MSCLLLAVVKWWKAGTDSSKNAFLKLVLNVTEANKTMQKLSCLTSSPVASLWVPHVPTEDTRPQPICEICVASINHHNDWESDFFCCYWSNINESFTIRFFSKPVKLNHTLNHCVHIYSSTLKYKRNRLANILDLLERFLKISCFLMKTNVCTVMVTGLQIEDISIDWLCKRLIACVDMVVTSGLEIFNELYCGNTIYGCFCIFLFRTHKLHNKDNKSPVYEKGNNSYKASTQKQIYCG